MTQISFHCTNATNVVVDPHDAEVDDFFEARHQAARIVRSLIDTHNLKDWRNWVLHVNDDLGEELFVVPFLSALGKAHEHDDEMERLQWVWTEKYVEFDRAKMAGTCSLSQKEIRDIVAAMPETKEHSRLVKLTDPFHEQIGDLVRQMWTIPAITEAGRAAKVRVLLNTIAPTKWGDNDKDADWDIEMTRKLLIEFVGGESAAELRSWFAETAAA
jgi:hypothetical protein